VVHASVIKDELQHSTKPC